MIGQVRLYTINKGMMDSWVKLFNERLAPVHEKYEMQILGAWVNGPQNEFIWLRGFETPEEERDKTATYFDLPERKAIGDLPQQHIAKTEVRVCELAYASPQAGEIPGAAQFRLYTANRGQLDPFVEFFVANIAPLHAKAGIPILSSWTFKPQNEFIWFRGFDGLDAIDDKLASYNALPERQALGDRPGSFHAKQEIRNVEYVFDPLHA